LYEHNLQKYKKDQFKKKKNQNQNYHLNIPTNYIMKRKKSIKHYIEQAHTIYEMILTNVSQTVYRRRKGN